MNNFEVIKTPIKDLVIIQPKVFGDERGFFLETYNKKSFQEHGLTMEFVQDNHSKSKKGVLRGLHFQTKFTQGNGVLLTGQNKTMFYIPEGFAHGFLALEDDTEFMYKCTDLYTPEYDSGLLWNDETINIDWRLEEFGVKEEELTISDKDQKQAKFDKSKKYFE